MKSLIALLLLGGSAVASADVICQDCTASPVGTYLGAYCLRHRSPLLA
jgi:hypothetical protein